MFILTITIICRLWMYNQETLHNNELDPDIFYRSEFQANPRSYQI